MKSQAYTVYGKLKGYRERWCRGREKKRDSIPGEAKPSPMGGSSRGENAFFHGKPSSSAEYIKERKLYLWKIRAETANIILTIA